MSVPSDPILARLAELVPDAHRVSPKRMAKAKAKQEAQTVFAAQGRVGAVQLAVTVAGVGPLGRSLSAADATRLREASRQARFGHRERTLLDPAVRDTGELGPEAIELAWSADARDRLLREVAAALGTGPLEARLHNLLIYGPGQFFKPHQDTEKHAGMVGTLVLIWPSSHLGGELRIRHGSDELRFASQQLHEAGIRWAAFFADCRHEVLPVEEGYRVALTFDLVLRPADPSAEPAPDADSRLQAALRDRLGLGAGPSSNPNAGIRSGPGPGPDLGQGPDHDAAPSLEPWVFLLDHEYTEHGLRWPLLKGLDRPRVAALRAAAEGLGLSVHLALVEVHESWTAEPQRDRWYRRGRDRFDDEDDDDGDGDAGGGDSEAIPQDLIEREIALDFWVNTAGHVVGRSAVSVAEDDIASFVDTGDEHLVNEEYEGYMGNYGETLDYWYRRAALVIQSPAAAERNRFKVDFEGALKGLSALARDGRQAAVLSTQVEQVADLLKQQVRTQGRALFGRYAAIAVELVDDQAARALLGAFDPVDFEASDAQALAALEKQRGAAWLIELYQSWCDEQRKWGSGRLLSHYDRFGGSKAPRHGMWPARLPEFTRACLAAGTSAEVLATILGSFAIDALVSADQERARYTPVQGQEFHGTMLDAVSELVAALRLLPAPTAALRKLFAHVVAQPKLYPPAELAALVTVAGPFARSEPPGRALRPFVVGALEAALASPEREPGDHSLRGIEWCCACTDCQPVRRWAEAVTKDPLVLAIVQARRSHVVEQLRSAVAPIASETLKIGSPHKLRLTKPGDLHARDQAQRAQWRKDLQSLGASSDSAE